MTHFIRPYWLPAGTHTDSEHVMLAGGKDIAIMRNGSEIWVDFVSLPHLDNGMANVCHNIAVQNATLYCCSPYNNFLTAEID